MKILVTGAAGFVGSHIVRHLDSARHTVFAVDVARPPRAIAASDSIELIRCDVTESESLAAVIARVGPDAVVHAAAITPGHEEVDRAAEVLQVNLTSTLTALVASANSGCRRFIYLSSAGVYQNPGHGLSLTEESPVDNTGGLYAQSKLASENLCAWATRELGLSTVSLRVGPVYGEFERPTETRSRMSPLHQAIALATEGREISCNAPEAIYNWIHGDDVGRAILLAIEASSADAVYNLAGPNVSMRETLETVAEVIPCTSIEWTDDRESAALRIPLISRPMSSRLIAAGLGFSTDVSLRDGIRRTVEGLEGRIG